MENYWFDFDGEYDDDDDAWYCGAVCVHGGECCRPEGHNGEHATKGLGDKALCTWGGKRCRNHK